MYKLLFLLVIGCKSQTTFNLYCEIPNGVSFKDSSQVFFNKKPVGFLSVEKVMSDRMLCNIGFKKYINFPKNSTLIFHENNIGNSYFEILEGNSNSNFEKKDSIKFFVQKVEQKSLDSKKIPNLERLTSPKIIIDSTRRSDTSH